MSLLLAFANVVPSALNVIDSGFTLAKTQCKNPGELGATGSHKLRRQGRTGTQWNQAPDRQRLSQLPPTSFVCVLAAFMFLFFVSSMWAWMWLPTSYCLTFSLLHHEGSMDSIHFLLI